MSEWKEYKLGKICDVRDGTHDSPKQVDIGKPLITSRHIKKGKIDFTKSYNISLSDYEQINKRSQVDKYDILFSMIGTVAETAIVDFDPDFAIKNVGLFKTSGDYDLARWVYYYLKSNEAIAEVNAALKGSTQQYITLGDLRKFPILFPSPEERKAIVGVLSSLDDKIDLLNRQNKTLEFMAAALWRWYFYFKRKKEGEKCVVADLARHSKQSICPKEKPDVIFEHYSIPAFDKASMPSKELGITIQSNKYLVESGTILFSKLNPHKDKRLWLIPQDISENSVCSTEFQVLQPKMSKYFLFLYGFLNHTANYNEIASGVGGTSGSHQRIDPAAIFQSPCFLPSNNRLEEYNVKVAEIFNKICINRKQSQALEKIRDTLLPKLMSGEVRVKY